VEGVDGRAKGTVRSKAEPWNERRVKNVSLGAKGDYAAIHRLATAATHRAAKKLRQRRSS